MEKHHNYGSSEYWDVRFAHEKRFEWLVGFDTFKHLVLPKLTPSSRILHIGCGASEMSTQLYEMGYTNITNVDFSKVVIENGRALHPEMEWICEDIRSLASIPSDAFDVVLEKAALESLFVGEKSAWSPSDSALNMMDNLLKSIVRVLTSAGVFISISFTQPYFRVPAFLRLPGWSVSVNEVGDFFHFFVYTMQRGEETSQDVRDRFACIAPEWSRSFTNIE